MIKDNIKKDMLVAMKAGDTVARDTLRMLDSMIKNEEISSTQREQGLRDDVVVTLVKRAIKQRTDSATQYRAGGRDELAQKEEAEIAILQKYLPEQMSGEEVRRVVETVVTRLEAKSQEDFGKVMGAVMKEIGDASDGTTVRDIVKEFLGENV